MEGMREAAAIEGLFLGKYLFRKLYIPCPPPSVRCILGIIGDTDTPGLFRQFLGPVHGLDFPGRVQYVDLYFPGMPHVSWTTMVLVFNICPGLCHWASG